jgi:hypothetical protein
MLEIDVFLIFYAWRRRGEVSESILKFSFLNLFWVLS